MFVPSTMIRTAITQMMLIASMAYSKPLTWDCNGGSSTCRSSGGISMRVSFSGRDSRRGRRGIEGRQGGDRRPGQTGDMALEAAVLGDDPGHDRHRGDDHPDDRQHVVTRRRARTAVAVGRARTEGHDARALLV